MKLTASGTLRDTAIMGGLIPQLAFDATLQQDTAHVKAAGSFAGFDPAAVSGRPAMKGMVGGTLDVEATVANVSTGVTPESVQATGKVTIEPSTVGGVEITSATIDGDYRDSTADIRTFELVGRDVNVQASGSLALNESGQSNLTVHADSPSLEEIGKLLGRPLSGIGMADLTVTGNRRELQAVGTVVGNGVKYGTDASESRYGALALSSDFTAKVPDLDIARGSVVGDDAGDLRHDRGAEHQRADREDRLREPAGNVRGDGQAATAVDDRRGFAGHASRPSGAAPPAARAHHTGDDLADGPRVRGDDPIRERHGERKRVRAGEWRSEDFA